MSIVAACVHFAGVAAGVGQASGFVDGERVDVRAEGDAAARCIAEPGNRCSGRAVYTGYIFYFKLFELGANGGRGGEFFVADFGNLVETMSQIDGAGEVLVDEWRKFHRQSPYRPRFN